MGLFRRSRPLPVTSYGYVAPPGATARGWRCPGDDCGTGGETAPRRWPFRCPECGEPVDPEFDEPWAHEARGPWLRRQMEMANQEVRGFWEGELAAWVHRDALRAGDASAARSAQAAAHRLAERTGGETTGSLHFHIVDASIRHDRLDDAAVELEFWLTRTRTDGVEESGSRRTNCRGLLGAMVTFLEHPGAAQHPAAPALRGAAAELRDAISEVLTVDLERRSRHLRADRFEPAGPPARVPVDPVERLVAFGRYSFDPMGSDLDPVDVWTQIVAPHHESAVADPDAWCRRLAGLALPAGGWAVYGAQRMVVELLGGDYRGREFLVMQDAALDWMHARGVASAHLTGYERARWAETRGAWAG
jgi:hypothetical protein